ncbi:F-type H+-transporting ATPase subunit b [Candidatus Magnetomoraceae bacterium gMMP-15]
MIVVDGSLVIQIINFLLLIWILNVILYKPIRKILIQRQEKIDGLENSITASKEGVIEKEKAFKEGINEAKAMGIKERDALTQVAQDEEKKLIDEINQKAQADLNELRARIVKEAEAARSGLAQQVNGFAQAIGTKILGRAV